METSKETCPVCPKFSVKVCGNVTVGPKGQIVIPKDIREQIGIETGDSLVIVVKGGVAIGLIKNEDMGKLMEYIKSEMGTE